MALYTITTKSEFEKHVLQNDKPVLVDFWANWCAPCRAMAPALHDIGSELDTIVDVVKVNIEASQDNQQLAGEYGVQSIPNMPIFQGGKEVSRIIGMVPKAELITTLTKVAQDQA